MQDCPRNCCLASPSIQNKSSQESLRTMSLSVESCLLSAYTRPQGGNPARTVNGFVFGKLQKCSAIVAILFDTAGGRAKVNKEDREVSVRVGFMQSRVGKPISEDRQTNLQSKQSRASEHAYLQRPPPAWPEVIRYEVLSYSKVQKVVARCL